MQTMEMVQKIIDEANIDEAQSAKLKEVLSKYQIYPANGQTVWKMVCVRSTRKNHYLSLESDVKTLIDSEYKLHNALEDGQIVIEERPMTKTDLVKIGVFTFLTKVECESAYNRYKQLFEEEQRR